MNEINNLKGLLDKQNKEMQKFSQMNMVSRLVSPSADAYMLLNLGWMTHALPMNACVTL